MITKSTAKRGKQHHASPRNVLKEKERDRRGSKLRNLSFVTIKEQSNQGLIILRGHTVFSAQVSSFTRPVKQETWAEKTGSQARDW